LTSRALTSSSRRVCNRIDQARVSPHALEGR
jgi:hypothetical protein